MGIRSKDALVDVLVVHHHRQLEYIRRLLYGGANCPRLKALSIGDNSYLGLLIITTIFKYKCFYPNKLLLEFDIGTKQKSCHYADDANGKGGQKADKKGLNS